METKKEVQTISVQQDYKPSVNTWGVYRAACKYL
jgi:hypothetical protein